LNAIPENGGRAALRSRGAALPFLTDGGLAAESDQACLPAAAGLLSIETLVEV
jgi:hypothetical protein